MPGWTYLDLGVDFSGSPGVRSFPTSGEVQAYRQQGEWVVKFPHPYHCGDNNRKKRRLLWYALALLSQNADLFSTVARVAGMPLAEQMRDFLMRRNDFSGPGHTMTICVDAGADVYKGQAHAEEGEYTMHVSCCGKTNFLADIPDETAVEYQCRVLYVAAVIFHELFHFLGFEHSVMQDAPFAGISGEEIYRWCDFAYQGEVEAIQVLSFALGIQRGACDFETKTSIHCIGYDSDEYQTFQADFLANETGNTGIDCNDPPTFLEDLWSELSDPFSH